MRKVCLVGFFFILFITSFSTCEVELDRAQFPPSFLFGTGTSSYQIEGAYLAGNKGLSNWDVFTHEPGHIAGGSNGDVADDDYHRFMVDVELMHDLGVNAYRFSISWSRVLPKGRFGEVNPIGVGFYSNLINQLLLRGIEPYVTINHFDIPQVLEERYGSWLSSEIRKDYVYFAEICFKEFGHRVKYWTTFNEPNIFLTYGYFTGEYPPSRCSHPYGSNCSHGDSLIEFYVAAHNLIVSHAIATNLYRSKYQEKQGGMIGLVVFAPWIEPYSDSPDDRLAVRRALAFIIAFFLDPVIYGDYPPEMRQLLGPRLPVFTDEEREMLESAKLDFIGLNHYTAVYAKDCLLGPCPSVSYSPGEANVHLTGLRDGVYIGYPSGMEGFYIYPKGLAEVIMYVKERYNNTPMFITENGYGQANKGTVSELLNDTIRVDSLKSYLSSLTMAMGQGADVRGYFIWSLLDNFEWTDGYTLRFGLYYVDYKTLQRIPKQSVNWYKQFLNEYYE